MRSDSLRVSRWSPDRLTCETWGFEFRSPETYQLRAGTAEIRLRLVSYERATRPDTRKRKLEPVQRLLFAGHYPKGRDERRYGWLDVTSNSYAWENGDCRWASKVVEPPALPEDVGVDVRAAIRPVITVAE